MMIFRANTVEAEIGTSLPYLVTPVAISVELGIVLEYFIANNSLTLLSEACCDERRRCTIRILTFPVAENSLHFLQQGSVCSSSATKRKTQQ